MRIPHFYRTYLRESLTGFLFLFFIAYGPAYGQTEKEKEVFLKRVGTLLDSTERAYFGLFTAEENLLSTGVSFRSGLLTLTYMYKNHPDRTITYDNAASRGLIQFVNNYEYYARKDYKPDLVLLRPFSIKVPLKRKEKTGNQVTLNLFSGYEITGQIVTITKDSVYLWPQNFGYDAELSDSNLIVVTLDSIKEIYVRKHTPFKYILGGTGLLTALVLGANGIYLPFVVNEGGSLFTMAVAYTGIGYFEGLGLDKNIFFKKKIAWAQNSLMQRRPIMANLEKYFMFPNQVPPEIRSRDRYPSEAFCVHSA